MCGEPDVFNTDPDGPQGSVLHAAGRVIDDDGTSGYGSHLKVGEASDALFGPGLLDARAAEVILVLRSQISELVSEMLRTFTLIQAGDGATTRLRGRSAQLLPSKCAG
jgi:hypothetical protein